MTTTASYSPNQNGLNEKNHHYVDFMMSKMMLADPACSPEIALTWAIHASNVLENRYGASPSMLVFGRNVIAHPDLCPTAPSTLESNVDVSKKIAAHLNALSKAREAFMQAESSKTIADALKARIVNRVENVEVGNWIYYKNLEVKQWQGPVKVVMIDNKNVFTIKNNKLVSINKDHVVLQRTEDDEMDELLTLPPLPNQEENHSATQEHPSLPNQTHETRKGNRYQHENELEVLKEHEIANVDKEPSHVYENDSEPNTTVSEFLPSANDDVIFDASASASNGNNVTNEEVEDPSSIIIPESQTSRGDIPFISDDPVRSLIPDDPGRPDSYISHGNRDKHHFKVACNTCDKKMLRASIVRHARNAHYLKGTWQ